MSSALLAVNALLFLTYDPLCEASSLYSTLQLNKKRNETSHDMNEVNSQGQSNLLRNIESISTNSKGEHHQIHKRNLNRDFPMANLASCGRQESDLPLANSSSEALIRDDKPVLNELVGKIALDDTALYHGDIVQTPNDTTKLSFTDELSLSGNEKLSGENQGYYLLDDGSVINNCDSDIFFVNRPEDNVNTIDLFSINGVSNMKDNIAKREITDDETNLSNNSTAIEEEMGKVYKDISDNVRLLSKLRDRESHMVKNPSKKRWIIVDNRMDDNMRKKKCTQELTVEMDTNKDATPDRLEHIERKVEEELLQVNVPIKCSH